MTFVNHEVIGRRQREAEEADERISDLKAENERLKEELGGLRKIVKEHADPDCPHCDGTGVFYGNVMICNCVHLGAVTKAKEMGA